MRTMKRATIAAAAVALSISLVGCSHAEKAADHAKNKAKEHGASMAAEASAKAKAKASELAKKAGAAGSNGTDGATGGSGESGSGDGTGAAAGTGEGSVAGVSIDLGDFADDPAAKAAGKFYTVRESVRTTGEGQLSKVATASYLPKVQRFIDNHPASSSSLKVVVNGVEGSTVQACVGPKAQHPRVLTVKGGKVARIRKGSFDC